MPDPPKIFTIIQKKGNVDLEEMYKTYNMGVGFIIIVPEDDVEKAKNILECRAYELGIVTKEEGVNVTNFGVTL